MVLHDPLDWALEAQVVVDVLRGGKGNFPVFFSLAPFRHRGEVFLPSFVSENLDAKRKERILE